LVFPVKVHETLEVRVQRGWGRNLKRLMLDPDPMVIGCTYVSIKNGGQAEASSKGLDS
jgi:hypothetical protein